MAPRVCSVANALELVGERWALLVVREVALGVRRFADILERTGAPRAVLSARLKSLVEAGVLTTSPYREPGQRERLEYRLTGAGRDLLPVVTALREWGDKHATPMSGPPVVLRHEACGGDVHLQLACTCGPVSQREVRVHPAPDQPSAS
ncbi:MAG: transcriptional regulator, HxlR family [Frankiales bacterium]|nr:transcriptional regulator, HxlR family [Frankiales bacterium]